MIEAEKVLHVALGKGRYAVLTVHEQGHVVQGFVHDKDTTVRGEFTAFSINEAINVAHSANRVLDEEPQASVSPAVLMVRG